MNRKTRAKGKIVRRLGTNIFEQAKYDKLLKKKPSAPGTQTKRRAKISEYGRQLKEKQKLKFAYGLSEKQFVNLFKKAKKLPGQTGHNMLILLEKRLDNVVYRLGLASTRSQARQMVSHGHVVFNGKRHTIPSALVRTGDVIEMKKKESTQKMAREFMTKVSRSLPSWLEFSEDDIKGTVVRDPFREDIPTVANEQSVVEFYSR
ncbi:30S ribosomal protein S4 [Spirochaeta cellobiosiphila]|uniref:30S ribosomal protein S4 n=1 Tax=Spirochaeta cellobiosiphila TaxID=504483 RepID=UPI00040F3B68|nr:30S ribosomal protein S4 [Spirochaeta cellobiosiphila]